MRYGQWGKHLELFEMYENWRGGRMEALAESGYDLQEADGTGAPEGRADFPLFLQTIIRMRTRERFATTAAKWRSYVGIESAQDFREHRISQMNGILGMGPVGENGEYPRMRSSEEPGPPFAVGKHGGVYSVTMELIINDEVDRILSRNPRELGRTAAEYVSRIVVALIESNPNYIDGQPFFSVARGNEVQGTGAVVSETNLAQVLTNMKLRRMAGGIPFAVQPRRILTQNDLTKMVFSRILGSAETGATSNDTATTVFDKGTQNPLYGVLKGDAVIDEPWFNDPNDWIVLGDAADRPAFVVAFLRNQQEPFIGLKNPEVRSTLGGPDPYTFDFDTIDYKVRLFVGVAVGEPFAAYRARQT